MEHAPLRPVPTRPSGPVDPADAVRHVASSLPAPAAPPLTVVKRAAPPPLAVLPLGEPVRPAPPRVRAPRQEVLPAPLVRPATLLAWRLLLALAVIFAVVAVAIAVAGALGAF